MPQQLNEGVTEAVNFYKTANRYSSRRLLVWSVCLFVIGGLAYGTLDVTQATALVLRSCVWVIGLVSIALILGQSLVDYGRAVGAAKILQGEQPPGT